MNIPSKSGLAYVLVAALFVVMPLQHAQSAPGMLEQRTYGPFNGVGYKGRVSTQEFLLTGKGTLNHDCSFTWVDDAFLEEHGVTSWGEMPAWTPASTRNHFDNRKAILHGLTFRPIAETIRDTLDWAVNERPKDRPWAAGMKPEREAELLEEWRARHT